MLNSGIVQILKFRNSEILKVMNMKKRASGIPNSEFLNMCCEAVDARARGKLPQQVPLQARAARQR